MTSADLDYGRLNEALVAALPELREAYDAEVAQWRGEPVPTHCMFGFVLDPYLSRVLAEEDEASVSRVFEFLERMALSPDSDVVDVLSDTVLEHLRDEPQPCIGFALDYLGTATARRWRRLVEPPEFADWVRELVVGIPDLEALLAAHEERYGDVLTYVLLADLVGAMLQPDFPAEAARSVLTRCETALAGRSAYAQELVEFGVAEKLPAPAEAPGLYAEAGPLLRRVWDGQPPLGG